ncbi:MULTISPECIES: hypothetical protein [unclassified Ruegeria]|uniref:hypothetical protein n=1 Tax=unclassified Ruegeria TaxID=2625375 RepID=UPI001ADC7E7B|nr:MULTISPECIES: hypothetical protein [unclassified Ruegeria]MBO9411746.1 hypothetical protein [Ruegeria sp. R8_1]MBO9415692.1 hypothetical protein [Ruegeria sp. R8_2]
MTLILRSLLLSVPLSLRMIFPVLIVFVLCVPVWFGLGIVTLGLSQYISEGITTAFISMIGIRAALALTGDRHRTDFKNLIAFAILYGLFFIAVLAVMNVITSYAAVGFSLWKIGEPLSLSALQSFTEDELFAFGIYTLLGKVVVSTITVSVVYALMAVPLANAARAAGHGLSSPGFFNGFGRSFIPLFCVFFLSIFPIFYFELLSFLYALLPLILSVVSFIFTQTLPEFELEFILKGVASLAALLWLNAWIWSITALALLKFDDKNTQRSRRADRSAELHALRKSRQRY